MKERPTNPDDLEAFVLERARAGMTPSPSRRHNALAGIAAGLSLPPPALPGSIQTLGSASGSAGTGSLAGSAGTVAAHLATGAVKAGAVAGGFSFKAAVVVAVTTTVIGVGAYLTTSIPVRPMEPREPAPATVPAGLSTSGSVVDPEPGRGRPELPPPERAQPQAASAHPAAARMRPGAGSVRTSDSLASTQLPPPARPEPVHHEVLPIPPSNRVAGEDETRSAPDAARELAALREAQSALARGDGAAALRSMRRLDETDAAGVLSAERAVTQVLALCQMGRAAEATTVARQALRDGQGTALYRRRLAASCARIDDEE